MIKRTRATRTATSSDAYAGRLADLQTATRAIGSTHAARLKWVVGFAAEDAAAWHSAMRAAHGDCLITLAHHGRFLDNLIGGGELPSPLAPREVDALHAELRAMLRDLVNSPPGQEWRARMVMIPTDGLTEGLIRLTGVGVKPALWASSYGQSNVRTALFQAVKALILQAGERLLACPECGTALVAVRKQRFCSARCAQKARNDRKAARRRGASAVPGIVPATSGTSHPTSGRSSAFISAAL